MCQQEFGTCCLNGKIVLPEIKKPPRELRELYNGVNNHSSHFLKHIVSYNNAYAFVSIAHKTVDLPGHGPNVYTIQGELQHHMGALLPELNKDPVYAQLYF